MHGLVISAVRRFVIVAYGKSVWNRVLVSSGVSRDRFQSVLPYDAAVLETLICSVQRELCVPLAAIMEDIGISIVTQWTGIRRLLRYGGATFHDFLHSLDDLPDRARLAMPELVIPEMRLDEAADGVLALSFVSPVPEYGHVVTGLLRAMADDYGALVTIRPIEGDGTCEVLSIQVHDATFTQGNRFDLLPGLWR